MFIRRETREKARRCLAFSCVSKPHTHITHMLRQCTSIVYLLKYKSTVSHSPIEWAYYASGIGKPDVCCYCAAEGIQQDNDLKKKY